MLDRIRVQCVQNILSLCFVECFNLFSAPYLSYLVKIRSFDLLAYTYIATVAIHNSGSKTLILITLILLSTCIIYW